MMERKSGEGVAKNGFDLSPYSALFCVCFCVIPFYEKSLLNRENIMSGRWRSDLYAPIPWVKTEIITDIGGSSEMVEYLLRVLIPSSGDTIVARKRYQVAYLIITAFFCFNIYL